jgi:hypothetical protein
MRQNHATTILCVEKVGEDDNGAIRTHSRSITHKVLHSPTGLSWGYGGSGCADLARSILFECGVPSWDNAITYQQFKWDIIANLNDIYWELYVHEVTKWYSEFSRLRCHDSL